MGSTMPAVFGSCASFSEFNSAIQLLNAECCDEPSEDCSSGYPATCNSGCATVLLTVQSTCGEFLSTTSAMKPVKAAIDAAAAKCPPLVSSCTTFTDFNDATNLVDAECCDEPSEDCSSGYPATCNSGCATVLLTVQSTCGEFLSTTSAMKPVKAAIDAAAATCSVRPCSPCLLSILPMRAIDAPRLL